ncbi:hypothetical protein [Chryseobacterium echinoideorum]|uniref:hypothetical protein n=1 Tax=Chryseobacterium echinoideorum TaxID=1549648 RepID=UPI001186DCC9|nr:hypothetical protein [Chryseobacterium echinoideorum]
MLSLFSKKHWYHFYLPVELINRLPEISTSELERFLLIENINFVKINIQKITNNLDYVGISFRTENELILFKNYVSQFKELLPPWFVFPEVFQGSPRWNQGYQEHYCINNWLPYWKKLNKIEKEKYLFKYDCPNEWKTWFINNNML